MNNHVTLKLVDPEQQQFVRVRSGPSVNCVWTAWGCGACGTYTSKTNTYRVISKTCAEHTCLIPREE